MHGVIWTIMDLEEDTTVLNNATKVHKLLIKIIHLRERILFQMVNFHKKKCQNY